jgi:hypothetical protein
MVADPWSLYSDPDPAFPSSFGIRMPHFNSSFCMNLNYFELLSNYSPVRKTIIKCKKSIFEDVFLYFFAVIEAIIVRDSEFV